MKTLTFFSALWCLVNFCNPTKLPSSFTKCDTKQSDFDDCLSRAIKNAITQLDKPLKEYNLPSLEPLFLPMFLAKENGIKRDVDCKFKNYKIFGHTTITDLKAKMDLEKNTLTISITNPEVRYQFDYVAKGAVFFLPIDTAGQGLVIAHNVTYTVTFTFEEYTRDDQKYLLVIDSKLKMAPQSMTIRLENLFDDEILNDRFFRKLTSSWKKALDNFAAVHFDGYAQGYGNVFNKFLEEVPLSGLFDN